MNNKEGMIKTKETYCQGYEEYLLKMTGLREYQAKSTVRKKDSEQTEETEKKRKMEELQRFSADGQLADRNLIAAVKRY